MFCAVTDVLDLADIHFSGNDMEEDHYKRTRKMSTYLLAFVIGDFEYAAANTSKGLLVRLLYSPPYIYG